MIDFDKFKYRRGDKIRKIGYEAEYEIIDINEGITGRRSISITSYRIKNLSEGCIDQPVWLSQSIIHRSYEPCNPAIKVLFEKKEPQVGVLTKEILEQAYSAAMANFGKPDSKLLFISTPRQAGKNWYEEFLSADKNRAGEQSSPHSLDALRYLVQGQPPTKKVSR